MTTFLLIILATIGVAIFAVIAWTEWLLLHTLNDDEYEDEDEDWF